eukprot:scaffold19279_cov30-Phaeocystis_antarctica.AAC.2
MSFHAGPIRFRMAVLLTLEAASSRGSGVGLRLRLVIVTFHMRVVMPPLRHASPVEVEIRVGVHESGVGEIALWGNERKPLVETAPHPLRLWVVGDGCDGASAHKVVHGNRVWVILALGALRATVQPSGALVQAAAHHLQWLVGVPTKVCVSDDLGSQKRAECSVTTAHR